MTTVTYTAGELRKLIRESQNEFKPKIGKGVEADDKKNSEKSCKDIAKETGAKEAKYTHNLPEKEDDNKTTLDYTFDNDPGSDYQKRIHAQAKGYTSDIESKNNIEKDPSLEFDDSVYKNDKKAAKKSNDMKKALKKSGLQASKWPDEIFDKKGMFESKNIKTVHFKQTSFISEGHMLSRIPDEFKNEGNIFKMKDKNDNTYLIEWSDNKGNILEYRNVQKVNEEMSRIKSLFNYKSSDKYSNTTYSDRESSNNGFNMVLENVRKIKD